MTRSASRRRPLGRPPPSGEPEAAVGSSEVGSAPYTFPDGVEVTGNLTLDDLRRVFPGY